MDQILNYIYTETIAWSPRIGSAIVIFTAFYILSIVVKSLIVRATFHLNVDDSLILLLARTSKVVLIILGILTALGTLGINITALVASLGLTGFALGFALKDTISNMLSGVLILLYKPFKVGDTIIIGGFQGTITAIDLRYTQLDSQNSKILIPNSKSFTDPITVLNTH